MRRKRMTSIAGKANGRRHLGDVVWWALREAEVRRDDLVKAVTDAGLSERLVPREPPGELAYSRAVRRAQIGEEKLIREISRASGTVVHGIVREDRDASESELDYELEARVGYLPDVDDPDRPGQVVTDNSEHQTAKRVLELFAHFSGLLVAEDVRSMILTFLDLCGALTLREGGGVYWVPSPYAEQLRALQGVVGGVGRSEVCLLPIYDSEDGRRTLTGLAEESLDEQVAQVAQEIEQWDEKTRASTMERRIEAFDGIRARAKMYQEILGIARDALDKKVGELEQRVGVMLAGKKEERKKGGGKKDDRQLNL